jgi:YD repeat-containing protein
MRSVGGARLDALGKAPDYRYDRLGDLAVVTDPLQGGTRYGYDAGGNRTSVHRRLSRGYKKTPTKSWRGSVMATCRALYEYMWRLLEERTGRPVHRPTELAWRILEPELANAILAWDGIFAYVVPGPVVTMDDVATAAGYGGRIGCHKVIVFYHVWATVEPNAKVEAAIESVELEPISDCDCSSAGTP